MRRTALAVTAVALLVPISCQGGNEADDRSAAATSTTTAAPTSDTTTASAPTSTSAPTGGTTVLALKPDGIGDLAFGATEAEVRAALTKALGKPTFDESLPAESCSTGATRRVSWGDLAVFFGPASPGGGLTMEGWTYGTTEPPAEPALTTAEGIGVGSTVAQLRAAYGERVQVSEDPAAGVVRFTVQGSRYQLPLAGVVGGPGDTATVRALYGGDYCAG